jgi:hypothetical protein
MDWSHHISAKDDHNLALMLENDCENGKPHLDKLKAGLKQMSGMFRSE